MGREVHCSYFRIYMSGNAPCLTYLSRIMRAHVCAHVKICENMKIFNL